MNYLKKINPLIGWLCQHWICRRKAKTQTVQHMETRRGMGRSRATAAPESQSIPVIVRKEKGPQHKGCASPWVLAWYQTLCCAFAQRAKPRGEKMWTGKSHRPGFIQTLAWKPASSLTLGQVIEHFLASPSSSSQWAWWYPFRTGLN